MAPRIDVAVALAAVVAVACGPARGEDRPTPAAPVRFNRDVRAILSDKCFQCHGPDESQRKGKLRLDSFRNATAPAASGDPAVVPGDAENSELIRRIASDDPEERMPPAKTGKPLTADEAKTLRDWIDQGAEYEGHWAFIPPERPPVPSASRPAWARNAIDAWILERLDEEGLAPSPEADKVTLLRRLSLDLIGLPPTIAEVDAFLDDDRADAYDRLVDRLLESPHYGERWGRIWLDAARYADSDGYEKDKPRTVHFYRDWVVSALNRDLPYDRFIVEQLAGDLLPDAGQDQVVATGFLRNSMINEEGGVDPEQFRVEAMFDRMDAIGKAVLGLTIQCAQCHTHKYDPIQHTDYYRMLAFLNNTDEAAVAVYTPEERRERDEIFGEIAAIEDRLRRDHSDWADRMRSWEEAERRPGPAWSVVRTETEANNGTGQKHTLQPDGSILASGYAPTLHNDSFTALEPVHSTVAAIRLELLNDPSLPLSGPGRSTKGLFGLTEFRVEAAPADGSSPKKEVAIVRATADVAPPETPLEPIFDDRSGKRRVTGPIDFAIDRKGETAWGIDAGPGRRNVPRKAVFVLEKPVSFPSGAVLTFKLDQRHGGWNSDDNQNNNLGRFRFSVTDSPDAQADPVPAQVREILAIPAEKRTPEQVAAVFSHFRTTVPEWKEANDRIEALWKRHPQGSSQLVLRDRPRVTHRLERGDFLKPAEVVEPGLPKFLNPPPAAGPPSRLTLARWMVDRKAPTTARSLVNRVWQAYFGTGLTATSEDLGSQCEPPSHPELLDWLAVEFMDGGWSLKRLHRLIVTSSSYRQASRATPELTTKDPFNRLLARGARVRADAEVVRDVVLAAGGLLDPTIGGPSVNPPAPAFLFQPPASYGPKPWPEAAGSQKYRRALYTFRFRSIPYPILQAFDAPNADFACVRRSRSNTPLQALALLNEPVSLDSARSLATLTLKEGGTSDDDRIAYAFRRCLARRPTDAERQVLVDLLRKQSERFAADPEDAAQLSGNAAGAAPAEHASWTVVARVLLNLDETITKE